LLKALLASVKQFAHCQLCEFEPVLQIVEQGSSAVKVNSALRSYKASQVIVCAGAWSARLLKHSGVSLPVEPVCGQMLLYRLKLGLLNHLPLQRIVLHEGRYLIPRRDGHILVGSTLEHRGFNKHVTAEALASLKASAEKLMPALRGIEPVQQWAGLRPGSPDGIPVMGQIASGSTVWVCAGHFRNGLVLSPASTRLMADLVLKRSPLLDPLPYAVTASGANLPSPVFAGDNVIV
jgi:glycine oxidase